MSCPDGQHDLRAILPFVHPTAKDAKGDPLEIIGGKPQTDEEPAWCRKCGALYSKRPSFFGMGGGWGFAHHDQDTDAPTLGNMLRDSDRAKRSRHYLAIAYGRLALRGAVPSLSLSEEAEAEIAKHLDALRKDMSDFDRRMVDGHIELAREQWSDA